VLIVEVPLQPSLKESHDTFAYGAWQALIAIPADPAKLPRVCVTHGKPSLFSKHIEGGGYLGCLDTPTSNVSSPREGMPSGKRGAAPPAVTAADEFAA
jgi:hypothetical protein